MNLINFDLVWILSYFWQGSDLILQDTSTIENGL